MSEPYNTVNYIVEDYKTLIHELVESNESNFFIEENWYLLRHIKMIGKKMRNAYQM